MLLYPTQPTPDHFNFDFNTIYPTPPSAQEPLPYFLSMPTNQAHNLSSQPLAPHKASTAPAQPPPRSHLPTKDPFTAKSDSARWTLLSSRSLTPTATPPFIYGVLSTKIFCRPTCAARLARRANVVFFDTPADAAAAGFRACKRCKPDVIMDGGNGDVREGDAMVMVGDGEEGRRKVVKAVEIIRERAEKGETIGLAELGREVGLSKWHLLRIFRKRWGVSPKVMGEGWVQQRQQLSQQQEGGLEDSPGVRMQTPAMSEGGLFENESSVGGGSEFAPETPVMEFGAEGMMPFVGEEAAMFDFGVLDFDVDAPLPSLWKDGESADDVLRELFPELNQYQSGVEGKGACTGTGSPTGL